MLRASNCSSSGSSARRPTVTTPSSATRSSATRASSARRGGSVTQSAHPGIGQDVAQLDLAVLGVDQDDDAAGQVDAEIGGHEGRAVLEEERDPLPGSSPQARSALAQPRT